MTELALRQAGGFRSLVDFYVTTMRTSIQQGFQYRAAHYMYMLGMVAEPVIYLVVWSTIAEQSGGSVNGLTPGYFAAYYIVWTLVRNMNIVFTPTAGSGASVKASSRANCSARCTRSTTTSRGSRAGRSSSSCSGFRSPLRCRCCSIRRSTCGRWRSPSSRSRSGAPT